MSSEGGGGVKGSRIPVSGSRIPEDFWVIETVCPGMTDKLSLLKEALGEYEEWLREGVGDIDRDRVISKIMDFIYMIEGV